MISLVGNKLDLVDKDEDKREVSYQEAKNFADENKLFFIETSALVNLQVNEAFENLIEGKHCKFIEKYTKLNK